MNKPILAVDLDGVLADHLPAFWGCLGRPENLHVYSLYVAYPSVPEGAIDDLLDDLQLYADMQPMPGAVVAMQEAAEYWEIMYITSRPQCVADATECWIRDHGFPLGKLHLTCLAGTLLLTRNVGKARHARLKGARILIDDNPAVARVFAQRQTALIFQDPAWPYGMQGYGDAVPVSTWAQARFFLALWRMGHESQ